MALKDSTPTPRRGASNSGGTTAPLALAMRRLSRTALTAPVGASPIWACCGCVGGRLSGQQRGRQRTIHRIQRRHQPQRRDEWDRARARLPVRLAASGGDRPAGPAPRAGRAPRSSPPRRSNRRRVPLARGSPCAVRSAPRGRHRNHALKRPHRSYASPVTSPLPVPRPGSRAAGSFPREPAALFCFEKSRILLGFCLSERTSRDVPRRERNAK